MSMLADDVHRGPGFVAAAGGCGAAAHGLVANPNYFAVNAVFLKLRRHFGKCGGGIAFLARTSVDE